MLCDFGQDTTKGLVHSRAIKTVKGNRTAKFSAKLRLSATQNMSPGDKCAKGVTAAAKYFRWGGHSGRQEAIQDSCQDGYSDAGVRLELSNKHPRFVPLNSTFIRGSKPQSFVSRDLLVKPHEQCCKRIPRKIFQLSCLGATPEFQHWKLVDAFFADALLHEEAASACPPCPTLGVQFSFHRTGLLSEASGSWWHRSSSQPFSGNNQQCLDLQNGSQLAERLHCWT